jgi:lipooligosaccharide transport system permease protein
MSIATARCALPRSKVLTDAITITHLEWLRVRPNLWQWTTILFLYPVTLLFFARYILPVGVEVTPRLIAGSMVYSLGLTSVLVLAQNLNFARFSFQLKLIQACPVSRYSYVIGSLVEPVIRSSIIASLILLFAPVFGIEIRLSPWLAPVVVFTALSFSGVAFIIGTWAPTQEIGNMIANTVGIIVTLMSPIYFPVERLPDWMEPIARLSPYTYAANALDALLSGRAGFYDDLAVLAAITAAGLVIGLAGMRWREV